MRFLVDECVSGHVADELRSKGHDASWATAICPGVDDGVLMALAFAEKRFLLTFDRGIGNRAVIGRRPAVGVILVAPNVRDVSLRTFAKDLARRVDTLGDTGLAGKLTILERDRTRQRDFPGNVDRT